MRVKTLAIGREPTSVAGPEVLRGKKVDQKSGGEETRKLCEETGPDGSGDGLRRLAVEKLKKRHQNGPELAPPPLFSEWPLVKVGTSDNLIFILSTVMVMVNNPADKSYRDFNKEMR